MNGVLEKVELQEHTQVVWVKISLLKLMYICHKNEFEKKPTSDEEEDQVFDFGDEDKEENQTYDFGDKDEGKHHPTNTEYFNPLIIQQSGAGNYRHSKLRDDQP